MSSDCANLTASNNIQHHSFSFNTVQLLWDVERQSLHLEIVGLMSDQKYIRIHDALYPTVSETFWERPSDSLQISSNCRHASHFVLTVRSLKCCKMLPKSSPHWKAKKVLCPTLSWCPKPSGFVVNAQQRTRALADMQDLPILLSAVSAQRICSTNSMSNIFLPKRRNHNNKKIMQHHATVNHATTAAITFTLEVTLSCQLLGFLWFLKL